AHVKDGLHRGDGVFKGEEREHGQPACARRGHEPEFGAGGDAERPLAPAHETREVDALGSGAAGGFDLVEDEVEAVAGVAPDGAWESLTDEAGVPGDDVDDAGAEAARGGVHGPRAGPEADALARREE